MNAPVLFLRPRNQPSLTLLVREEGSSYGVADESREAANPNTPSEPETVSDWALAHARIVALGKERAGHEREVCRWLSCAERLGVHARAGYASLREYAERVLGLAARQTEERLRVGRALADLPALDGALASGSLSWSAVRELSRIATAATEQAWIDWAKGRRARAIEKAAAARRFGDGPRDAGDTSRIPHRLSFAVRAETLALFRDLQARVRGDLGGEADDDTLLFEIARRALAGADDDGRASYQVAVSRCESCGRTSIDAGGASEVVDPAIAEMFDCDHQHIGRVHGGAEAKKPHVGASPRDPRENGDPEGTRRNWIPASAGMTSTNNGQSSTTAEKPRATQTIPAEKPRATQTIPPAIRRQVVRRDRKRCIVPGCANHRFLDVHHLDPRAEGGGHDPERLALVCGAHHRAAHRGRLWIDGKGSTGFVVRHAGGEIYGAPPSPPAIDAVAEAQRGLEHLGFKPTQARALLEAALRAGAPHDATALVHEALRRS